MKSTSTPATKGISRTATLVLASVTVLVLVVSLPDSLRDDYQRGGLYMFSRSFIRDIPKRVTGPGRFRLILQPVVAAFLGIRSGLADSRGGRPPYISGVLFHRWARRECLKSGFRSMVNLMLMSVLFDSLFQWMIYGSSHPGAALVFGPVLVGVPYVLARDLTNRCARIPSSS
jgi:hypothetical protein